MRRDVDALVTAATGRQTVPVPVAYNVPNRDCSLYSAGGARDGRAYRAWIAAFARGIGDRRALVILEPDALAGLCGKGRLGHLRGAVDRLARAQTSVHVDAGHSNWEPAGVMARRLRKVHVQRAAGFALNVSNFRRTDEIVAYGMRISSRLGGARFVIDTSRNGRGPWHAPRGRRTGATRRAAASARGPRRRRATRSWPRSCGSRRPASPTASAPTATTRLPATGGRATRSG